MVNVFDVICTLVFAVNYYLNIRMEVFYCKISKYYPIYSAD
jgi:hypothetical protein